MTLVRRSFGDLQGDSDAAATVGPYRDAGLGAVPAGEARDKSNPFCYGPETIVGLNDGVNDSTEAELYCYQDGGEEEVFFDYDGNGLYDIGNGIYNGSRCLTPLQDADGGGVNDDVVCTTDLINISRSVEILMAGSFAVGNFRSCQDPDIHNCTAEGSGGANGGGEIINRVVEEGGVDLGELVEDPGLNNSTVWNPGASVTSFNGGLATISVPGGSANAETILSQEGIFSSGRTHTIVIEVTEYTSGDFEVDIGGTSVLTCNAVGSCVTGGVTEVGDLDIVVQDGFIGKITSISVTATTTGQTLPFALTSAGTVVSNDNTAVLSQFNIGDDPTAADTVFAGISERLAQPLSTTNSIVTLYVTDSFNGQLPDGTTIVVEADNEFGCGVTSVGGVDVDPPDSPGGVHSGTVTVGENVRSEVRIGLVSGFGAGGSVIATVITPIGNVTVFGLVCDL